MDVVAPSDDYFWQIYYHHIKLRIVIHNLTKSQVDFFKTKATDSDQSWT